MRGACLLALVTLAGCGGPACPADSFSHMQACVFKVSCNFSSCHSASGKMGGLDLETDPYDALLAPPDAAAAKKRNWIPPADWRRVAPGDEMRSFFWIKLTMPSGKDPNWGDHMPDTGQSLDEDVLVQILEWIRSGAPNN